MAFTQHSEKAQEIMFWYKKALIEIAVLYDIKFKEPAHDIAMRFLNEIEEFKKVG